MTKKSNTGNKALGKNVSNCCGAKMYESRPIVKEGRWVAHYFVCKKCQNLCTPEEKNAQV